MAIPPPSAVLSDPNLSPETKQWLHEIIKTVNPETQPDHVRAGNNQYYVGNTFRQYIVEDSTVTNVTKDTWETIGPTGSGATNIWTDLDIIPEQATGIMLLIYGFFACNSASVGATSYLSIRPEGTTISNLSTASLAWHGSVGPGLADNTSSVNFLLFPLNRDKIFEVYWSDTNTNQSNIFLGYRGFVTD